MKASTIPQIIKLYKRWQKNQGSVPYTIELLLSSRCNMKCVMCNVWKLGITNPNIQEKELSIPELNNLIDELSRLGTKVIYLSGGEPLLKKEIFSIIRIAKAKKIKVGMITNGTLITERVAKELLESGLDHIIFSIDSPEVDLHEQIRGVKGSWKKATNGLRLMDKLRKEMNKDQFFISVHFLVTRKNYELIENMIESKSQLGYNEIGFLPVVGKTVATEEFFLRKNDLEALKKRLPSIKAKLQKHQLSTDIIIPLTSICNSKNVEKVENYGIYNLVLPRHIKDKILCFAPWKMATIDPFGNVYPCCHACTFQNLSEDLIQNFWGAEDFKLGNIKQNSFEEIWNGQKYIEFRDQCKNPPHFPMCKSCSYDFSKNILLTGLFKDRTILLKQALSFIKKHTH